MKQTPVLYKTLLFPLSLFLVLTCLPSCDNKDNQNQDPALQKEILFKRVEDFNNAFKLGDVETLESMITEDYVHTNSNSKSIGKAEWVNYLRKRKAALDEGTLKVENYTMDDTEVVIHDDMAIVTGKISFTSIRSGERKDNEIRITNVWVKDGQEWKRAGFHDTRIK